MRTISAIGNRPPWPRAGTRGGFTFFEAMVTVAIFAGGIVMIYKALISSLDYQVHLTNRLYALHYIEDQYRAVQRDYRVKGEVPFDYDGKTNDVVLNNRPVHFVLSLDLEDPPEYDEGFHECTMTLNWVERGGPRRIQRAGYLSRL